MKQISLIILAAVVATGAFAGECGVGGTAKGASGVEVTRTNEQAIKDQVKIIDGVWWKCKMPQPKVDLPCRMSGGIMPTWTENGVSCKSSRVITGPIPHGTQFGMMSGTKGTLGYQRMRCNDGVPQVEYAFCMKR
jgi:hypothetical protein